MHHEADETSRGREAGEITFPAQRGRPRDRTRGMVSRIAVLNWIAS